MARTQNIMLLFIPPIHQYTSYQVKKFAVSLSHVRCSVLPTNWILLLGWIMRRSTLLNTMSRYALLEDLQVRARKRTWSRTTMNLTLLWFKEWDGQTQIMPQASKTNFLATHNTIDRPRGAGTWYLIVDEFHWSLSCLQSGSNFWYTWVGKSLAKA